MLLAARRRMLGPRMGVERRVRLLEEGGLSVCALGPLGVAAEGEDVVGSVGEGVWPRVGLLPFGFSVCGGG